MPWVRKDDDFPNHRKIAPLNDKRYRLVDHALHWSSKYGTDGRIAADELTLVFPRATKADTDELVRRGIWHTPGYQCPSPQCPPAGPDGWVIHDFWGYQPSHEQVERDRAAKAERQRRWREARKGGGRGDADGDALRDPLRDASRNGPGDALVTPAPSPPRPAPPRKGGEGTASPPATAAAARAAEAGDDGRAEDQNPDVAHPPPPPNGRPPAAPPDTSALRAQIAAAARTLHARGDRRTRRAAAAVRPPSSEVPKQEDPAPEQPEQPTQETP